MQVTCKDLQRHLIPPLHTHTQISSLPVAPTLFLLPSLLPSHQLICLYLCPVSSAFLLPSAAASTQENDVANTAKDPVAWWEMWQGLADGGNSLFPIPLRLFPLSQLLATTISPPFPSSSPTILHIFYLLPLSSAKFSSFIPYLSSQWEPGNLKKLILFSLPFNSHNPLRQVRQ